VQGVDCVALFTQTMPRHSKEKIKTSKNWKSLKEAELTRVFADKGITWKYAACWGDFWEIC